MSDESRDDDLRAAFDALRVETRDDVVEDGPAPSATLRRVLGSARASTRRRFLVWKLGLPIAAALAVSSAWAAASGRFTDTVSASVRTNGDRVLEALARAHAPAPLALDSALAAPPVLEDPANADNAGSADIADSPSAAPALTTTAVARVDTESPSDERAPAPSSDPVPSSRTMVDRPATAPPAGSATAAASGSDALAADKTAFEAAYRASTSGTPADAVTAWDRYLAAHPDGRFVPEARYARAVALARAGDKSGAREALREFASGEPGSYRREDAVQLIDKLK